MNFLFFFRLQNCRNFCIHLSLILTGAILFLFSFSVCASDQMCSVKKSTDASRIFVILGALETNKQEQISFLKANPKQFCHNNLSLRFLNVNPRDAASVGFQCREMKVDQFHRYMNLTLLVDLKRRAFEQELYQSWFYSLVQTDLAQNLALGEPENLSHSIDTLSVETVEVLAEHNVQRLLSIAEQNFSPNRSTYVFQRVKPSSIAGQAEKRSTDVMAENIFVKRKICDDLNSKSVGECGRALDRLSEVVEPYFFEKSAYAPIAIWEKFISNEQKYREGLRLTALNLVQSLKTNNGRRSDIFSDLRTSFLKSGMADQEAIQSSFEILALYGNGGSNLGNRLGLLIHLGADSNCTLLGRNVCGYLDFIAKAIPILDYQNSKLGINLYSWPGNVVGDCNTNKSYHFWMAAYFSRLLIQEGFSANTALVASYGMAVVYQVNRDKGVVVGQTGMNAIKKSSYDPVLNVIRADLAYAFSGALYGLNPFNSAKISIDQSLGKLLEQSSEIVSDYSKKNISVIDRLQRYNRFLELVVPGALTK